MHKDIFRLLFVREIYKSVSLLSHCALDFHVEQISKLM